MHQPSLVFKRYRLKFISRSDLTQLLPEVRPTQTAHDLLGWWFKVNLSSTLGTSQQTTAFLPKSNPLATNGQAPWNSQFRDKEITHPLTHKHREEP